MQLRINYNTQIVYGGDSQMINNIDISDSMTIKLEKIYGELPDMP